MHEYIDHESGLKSERQEFKNLLAAASRHEFDVVLFWALDRFSREGTKKTLAYLNQLESYNVGFRSFTEQYLDSTGMFKDAVIGILAAVANMESVRRGETPGACWHGARQSTRKARVAPSPLWRQAKTNRRAKSVGYVAPPNRDKSRRQPYSGGEFGTLDSRRDADPIFGMDNGQCNKVFRPSRHLLRAKNYRE